MPGSGVLEYLGYTGVPAGCVVYWNTWVPGVCGVLGYTGCLVVLGCVDRVGA